LNICYGGEDGGGSYHSIYDSFDHYLRFGDPGFDYCVALAQTGGRIVLRLADADVLPLEFTAFADTLARYVKEVGRLADELREQTEEHNRQVRDRTLELAADPKQPFVAPGPKSPVPFVNFAPLQNALARVERSARAFDAARSRAGRLPADEQKAVDQVLMQSERALTLSGGLPGRPWFRHQVYAPGFYTGYGVKTLPGVREALEQRDWKLAEAQVEVVARTLEGFAETVDRATALLGGPGPN
jgi:N-acetylated-alpha-linked acidic dipeptidase